MTTATSHTLVCTECGQLNRVPAGKALSQGKCGTCGVTLAPKKPRDIDGATLSKLMAKDTGMYVLDLWAPWCGPCRMMAPSYAKTAEAAEYGDVTNMLQLPLWPVYAAILIGMGLCILVFAAQIVGLFLGGAPEHE